MTPAKPPKPSSDSPASATSHRGWSLTPQAFAKLLAAFSADTQQAGEEYEALRSRLIRFFEWRRVPLAEDRVDEVLNRVARRIDDGQQVKNIVAYAYGVGYLVFLETLKEPELIDINPQAIHGLMVEPQFEDTEQELRQRCFDSCLQSLTTDNRNLILVYYEEERGAKIEQRRNLADQLKITVDALRIRTHRIRKGLEECITSCMRQQEGM